MTYPISSMSLNCYRLIMVKSLSPCFACYVAVDKKSKRNQLRMKSEEEQAGTLATASGFPYEYWER